MSKAEPPAPVAIVGIGCRFPGGVSDPASFWRLLDAGVDAITEIPADRIDLGHYFDPRPATPGRMASRFGGYLDGIDGFDAEFFGISPREAERMDPQQRVLLECAWEALENAGQDPLALDGSDTGVFVGQWVSDFESRLFADPENLDLLMTTGSGRYALAGRLSYALGLRGPSLSLDTACSSSLAAVHLAVRAIQNGESQLALAGGVNLILQPHISIAYSQSRMMAPDGRCKFGDADGDGYVRSEGAGLVLLKPLAQALADGDRIYALIRGSAVNNDGRSSGVMGRPSRVGHEEMLRSAYRDAGLAPNEVGYVEAHGTGTRAGDPVEIDALAKVLGEGRAAQAVCPMGSVKTNIGHTEGAAGVAGLIKACLVLHHQHIPPSLHCRTPNPAVDWAGIPLAIAREARDWPRADRPRVAGVNSFGIGGSNAHVVLQEAPPAAPAPAAAAPQRAASLLLLSARSETALRALAARYAERLDGANESELAAICRSAALRRAALEHRAAFVAEGREALIDALRRFAAGESASAEGRVPEGSAPLRCAFVMPGQGAQWRGMARDLLRDEPVFRDHFARCDAAARPWLGLSLSEQLQAEEGSADDRFDDIDVVQPLLVALALSYAAWWTSIGVRPQAVLGHSMGEVAAACVAGALTLEQAMRVICRRSQLMKSTSGQGAMALVDLPLAEAQLRLRGREQQLAVAVNNSPRSCVVSGEPAALDALMAELAAEGVFCRRVKVDVASHSPQMQPLAEALAAELADLLPGEPALALYSAVFARRVQGQELGAGYWAANLRQPVRFADSFTQLLRDTGVNAAIELGPHAVLLPALQENALSLGHGLSAVACGQRDQGGSAALLSAVASLWTAGLAPDWARLLPAAPLAELPTYPWQRERHWIDAALRPASPGGERVKRQRPDAESLGWLYALRWQALDAPAPTAATPSTGPWLVVAEDAADAAAVAQALQDLGAAATASAPAHWAQRLAGVRQLLWLTSGEALTAQEGAATAYAPVLALQTLVQAGSGARLSFATRGAMALQGGQRVSPSQAALWGSARVLAEEQPERWGGLFDRDPDERGDAAALAQQLLAQDGEDQVALRGGQRFVARLRPLTLNAPPSAAPWRADSSVLITGGLGGIGLRLAADLVRQGVRRLILMGRTALPPRAGWAALAADSEAGRRVAAVRALEAQGASVHLAALDVGDEAQLRAFFDAYAAEGWPPIRAVVHAAGAFDNQLIGAMDRAAFDAALHAKLQGALALDRLLPDLDAFVLFSSTGAWLAQPGQANYAAANAGLDALAQDRRARGLPALSINWGVWAGTGLVQDAAGQRNVAEMQRQGIAAFAPERGLALFHWLLASREEATPVVLPMDWAQFARARAGRRQPLLAECLPQASAEAAETGASAAAGEGAEATPAQRRQAMESAVRQALGQVLKMPPARLDPRKALGAMGLNSLMAMELRNRLEAALGRSLSATLAWNYPTVLAMAAHLAGEDVPDEAPPAPRAAAPQSPDQAPELQVAGLSDDEAALALRGSRRRGIR